MHWVRSRIAIVLASAPWVACSPESDSFGPNSECTPGQQVVCPCAGGGHGVQVCNEAGTAFDACTGCGSSTGGSSAGGSSGAGGGQGGSGAAGGAGGSGATGPFSLTDSLKDANPKGSVVGGALGADGWTVTQKTDRIWYALPRLVEGSIQFTVSGITTANLDLADHEIFSLYEAGYGITEPIGYDPEFRDNHYQQLIRIYGQMVPDRLGLQKFIMLMCSDGAPGYGACSCPKSFYDGDGTWGGDPNWDGSPTTIKVAWGNGKSVYTRDGVEVWTNDYTQYGLELGPSELHFTIGCARHDAVADAGMPIGATFSDVVVEGIQGPVATCM